MSDMKRFIHVEVGIAGDDGPPLLEGFSDRYPVAVTQSEDWQLKLFQKARA